jgi:CBS domain-containing protein
MDTPLIRIASTPAMAVPSNATVQDAVKCMIAERIGAVAVTDGGRLVGIFTERDLMTKVVGAGIDASVTAVSEVMVSNPACVTGDTPRREALDTMLRGRFRHLPVTDEDGTLVGMLSIRDLMQHQMARLQDDVQSLEQYLAADGPGG